MTKDQVIHNLRLSKTRCAHMTHVIGEDMSRATGDRWKQLEAQQNAVKGEAEALSIAIELVLNSRSDNLVFKD